MSGMTKESLPALGAAVVPLAAKGLGWLTALGGGSKLLGALSAASYGSMGWDALKGLGSWFGKKSPAPRPASASVPNRYGVLSSYGGSPAGGFYPSAEFKERKLAFDFGVDFFCKEAGFDDEDRRMLYLLLKNAAAPVIDPIPESARLRPYVDPTTKLLPGEEESFSARLGRRWGGLGVQELDQRPGIGPWFSRTFGGGSRRSLNPWLTAMGVPADESTLANIARMWNPTAFDAAAASEANKRRLAGEARRGDLNPQFREARAARMVEEAKKKQLEEVRSPTNLESLRQNVGGDTSAFLSRLADQANLGTGNLAGAAAMLPADFASKLPDLSGVVARYQAGEAERTKRLNAMAGVAPSSVAPASSIGTSAPSPAAPAPSAGALSSSSAASAPLAAAPPPGSDMEAAVARFKQQNPGISPRMLEEGGVLKGYVGGGTPRPKPLPKDYAGGSFEATPPVSGAPASTPGGGQLDAAKALGLKFPTNFGASATPKDISAPPSEALSSEITANLSGRGSPPVSPPPASPPPSSSEAGIMAEAPGRANPITVPKIT